MAIRPISRRPQDLRRAQDRLKLRVEIINAKQAVAVAREKEAKDSLAEADYQLGVSAQKHHNNRRWLRGR